MATFTPIGNAERRLHTRHRAKTSVHIKPDGSAVAVMRIAKNLSASGVAVTTEGLGLKKGQKVTLSFAINLGTVTKIHRRTAIVAHVTAGVTGFFMDRFKE